ncbi:hypothetical protein V8F20_000744 [Naviculisporaceae sp. PSN 640]
MKPSTVTAVLAPAALAQANPWWGGAPDCAQNCFSSFWSTATGAQWPAPTNYCGATQAGSVSSCINSACSATPTAVTSYSSLSSSICAKWSSCSSVGSTSVYTVSLPAFTGSWGPGKGGHWGGRDHNGPWGDGDGNGNGWWGDSAGATRTWTGGVYTVTGCEWDGSPWAGGPGGWGAGGGRGGSPWGPWGHGWAWTTETKTITQVVPVATAGDGITSFSTSVGLATVAKAVSGESTTTSVLSGAVETGSSNTPSGNAAAGGMAGLGGVDLAMKVTGALLGAVLVVAGFL